MPFGCKLRLVQTLTRRCSGFWVSCVDEVIVTWEMSWFPITWNFTEIMRFAFKINLVQIFLRYIGSFYQFKFCVGHCIKYAVTFIAVYTPFHQFFLTLKHLGLVSQRNFSVRIGWALNPRHLWERRIEKLQFTGQGKVVFRFF